MIAIANRYYKLEMAYGGREIWEEFVLPSMHELRGIESPSVAERASPESAIGNRQVRNENPQFC